MLEAPLHASRGDASAAVASCTRALEILAGQAHADQAIARTLLERSTTHLLAGDRSQALDDAVAAFRRGRWHYRELVAPFSIQLAACLALTDQVERARSVLEDAERLSEASPVLRREQVRLGKLLVAALVDDQATWDALHDGARAVVFNGVLWRMAIDALANRGDERRAAQASRLFGAPTNR